MADKMMRIAGRGIDGTAKAVKTDEKGNIAVSINKSNSVTGNILEDLSWNWHSFPQSLEVRYTSKKYVGGTTHDGKQRLYEIDTALESVKFVDLAQLGADDHNPVVINYLSDGRLIVMYTGHAGVGGIKYRISSQPRNIDTLGVEQTLPNSDNNSKYINLFVNGDSIFVLSELSGLGWHVWVSTNSASSFDNGKPFLALNSGADYIDAGYRNEGNDRIGIALSPSGKVSPSNVYYVELDNTGKVRKADGTEIANVLTGDGLPFLATNGTLVYDGVANNERGIASSVLGNTASYNALITLITYPTFETPSYKVARYNKVTDQFDINELVVNADSQISGATQPHYCGSLSLVGRNSYDIGVLASVKENDDWKIKMFYIDIVSEDFTTQKFNEETIRVSKEKLIRPIRTFNSSSGLSGVWLRGYFYHFTGFYLDGETGYERVWK